jgi:holliday junction DNA helicase RuvB
MFFNRSKLSILFSHPVIREDKLFADVYGCDDIKRLFRMALDSKHSSTVLLTGPPACAKTLFLQCLMKLKGSHFIDCSYASKSGIVDFVFKNKPLDKLSRKDQAILLKFNGNRNSV